METLRVVDLFAGLGGFHRAALKLGHECVFASELDPQLRKCYAENFPGSEGHVHGDIRKAIGDVPAHDVLMAGFPCQPFSKSGRQHGTKDQIRGTLFHEVVKVAAKRQPSAIVLENVGNFERHDGGNTWATVKAALVELGYHVRGTEHKASGGHGLVSPHHFGFPHHRERFFAIASREEMPIDPFPRPDVTHATSLSSIEDSEDELDAQDKHETALTGQQLRCIRHWNEFIQRMPPDLELPSFPIWGDEFDATYPFEGLTPWSLQSAALARRLGLPSGTKAGLLRQLPSYARSPRKRFPSWKEHFIRESRAFYKTAKKHLPPGWLDEMREFPASLRKLEWNCKGEERDLWNCVLQFRPSGLRAKRYNSSPALVAMTTTQVPILGPRKRFLTRREGLRLQGFPTTWHLPKGRPGAFAALGNAVHVEVAKRIIQAAARPMVAPMQVTPVRRTRTR